MAYINQAWKAIWAEDDISNICNECNYIKKKNIKVDQFQNDTSVDESENDKDVLNKLSEIHKKLKIEFGKLDEEFPEQIMVTKYLKGDEKVLEIGGNIGRNSLVIASILNDSNNLVVLESDAEIATQLAHNKHLNKLNFSIESEALSKRKLSQKGWETIVSDELLPGYKKVNTVTFSELKNKYKLDFDTLVLDCEGAFYYILMDMPEILDNIKLVIMENDYNDYSHKKYIDEVLLKNKFKRVYSKSGGWGPCYDHFFEVWQK